MGVDTIVSVGVTGYALFFFFIQLYKCEGKTHTLVFSFCENVMNSNEVRAFVNSYVARLTYECEDGLSREQSAEDIGINNFDLPPSNDANEYVKVTLENIAYGRHYRHMERVPPLYELVVACINMWKEHVKPTVNEEWIFLFNNADYYNDCPPGFTIVTTPDNENWCIDNRLLAMGDMAVVMDFTSGPYWDDVIFMETLKKCVRPFKFFNGAILREVTAVVRLSELSEPTRSVINYAVHNMTYDLQMGIVESCKLQEPDVAIEELRQFILARCDKEIALFGDNPYQVIRFNHFTMSPRDVYVHRSAY